MAVIDDEAAAENADAKILSPRQGRWMLRPISPRRTSGAIVFSRKDGPSGPASFLLRACCASAFAGGSSRCGRARQRRSLVVILRFFQQKAAGEKTVEPLLSGGLAFYLQAGRLVHQHDAGGGLVDILAAVAARTDERFLDVDSLTPSAVIRAASWFCLSGVTGNELTRARMRKSSKLET